MSYLCAKPAKAYAISEQSPSPTSPDQAAMPQSAAQTGCGPHRHMTPEPITDPIKTFDLLKQVAREALSRNPEKNRKQRLDLLLRKTHQVGDIHVPLPNLLALTLIRSLDTTDRANWLCEVLYILHTQRDESRLFLRGDAREIEKARLLKDISAADLPNYMIAVIETLDMLEKKSRNYSARITEQMHNLISQLNSSPLQSPQANGSSIISPN